jgi:hypothetical protein
MMCYDKALRILARMEYPCAAAAGSTGGRSKLGQAGAAQYEAWLDRLIDKKVRVTLVACALEVTLC